MVKKKCYYVTKNEQMLCSGLAITEIRSFRIKCERNYYFMIINGKYKLFGDCLNNFHKQIWRLDVFSLFFLCGINWKRPSHFLFTNQLCMSAFLVTVLNMIFFAKMLTMILSKLEKVINYLNKFYKLLLKHVWGIVTLQFKILRLKNKKSINL